MVPPPARACRPGHRAHPPNPPMAATGSAETRLQTLIHSVEQGRGAVLLRGFIAVVAILAVALIFLGWRFRGFSIPEAMDQAQVGREVARGHGWSTQLIRPLQLWELESNNLPLPRQQFPDTYNAPLPPLVNAVAVKLAGDKIEFKPKAREYIAPVERFIVALSMLCFLASVGVEFLLLRRLFDARLAFWAASATLLCDLCWQYTLTGLPQMLMLLIFNTALYALVRALQIQRALENYSAQGGAPVVASPNPNKPPQVARPGKALGWMAVAGVCFGLLALSHALTLWLFLGALVYAGVHFRRQVPMVLIFALAFALVYTPWLVRNYRVSGNPFGLARYEIYNGISGTTAARMRNVEGPLTNDVSSYFFRPKIQHGIREQLAGLTGSLGSNLIALAFFLGLLHVFRRPEVNSFRWAVLLMWALAVVGMSLAGPGETEAMPSLGPNQIGVLFLPVMVGFGLAYLLVLFNRRESATNVFVRFAFYGALFVASALPLVFSLLPSNSLPFQYPPYYEPGISLLGTWTAPRNVIASDMPWAVAWYADRPSRWIPNKLKDMTRLRDNNKLPGNLVGLFLTPISRNTPFVTSVLQGEYKEYQPLIVGRVDIPYFPFKEVLPVMGDPTTYLFFSDTRRWDQKKANP